MCRQMYNDESAHAQSLTQQVQQANGATASAQADTRAALEKVEAAKAEAREAIMGSMRIQDELQRARQESKDLLVDNVRCANSWQSANGQTWFCPDVANTLRTALRRYLILAVSCPDAKSPLQSECSDLLLNALPSQKDCVHVECHYIKRLLHSIRT